MISEILAGALAITYRTKVSFLNVSFFTFSFLIFKIQVKRKYEKRLN